MSARQLTESGWKDFAKNRKLNDAAMLKALAAYGKSAAKGIWEQRATLDEVYKQSDVLLKATKADRDAQKYLAELQREIDAARASLAKAEKAAAASRSEDDEESPELLSTKLLTHIKFLSTNEGIARPFVIGVLSPKIAVLIHKSAIGPAHRKIVNEHLGGGAKFLQGECRFEKNALTFVMDKSMGGLAAKLVKQLQEQTGKKFKVRVRGSDPADVDEHDEDDDKPAPASGKPAAEGKAAATPKVPPAPPLPPGKPAPASTPKVAAQDKPAPGPNTPPAPAQPAKGPAPGIPPAPPLPATKTPAAKTAAAPPSPRPGPAAADDDGDGDEAELKKLKAWLDDHAAEVKAAAARLGDRQGKALLLRFSEAGALHRQKRAEALADAIDDIEAAMHAAAKLASAAPGAPATDGAPAGASAKAEPSAREKKLRDALTALTPKLAARIGAEPLPAGKKRVREAADHINRQIKAGRLNGAEASFRALVRYLKTPVEDVEGGGPAEPS